MAVCINETGGKIVNTPKYGLNDNYQVLIATIFLKKNGSMLCNAEFKKSGILMDDLIYLKDIDKKNQEKLIFEKYPSINLEIEDFKISETNDIFPKMTFDIKMNELSFLSKTGSFYTFKPNYLNRFSNSLKLKERRENNIFSPNSFIMTDTIKFILPENLKPEYLPDTKTFESVFGKYQAEYKFTKNEFFYIRTFMCYDGIYTKDKYTELNDFLNKVQIADNQNVIFKDE